MDYLGGLVRLRTFTCHEIIILGRHTFEDCSFALYVWIFFPVCLTHFSPLILYAYDLYICEYIFWMVISIDCLMMWNWSLCFRLFGFPITYNLFMEFGCFY